LIKTGFVLSLTTEWWFIEFIPTRMKKLPVSLLLSFLLGAGVAYVGLSALPKDTVERGPAKSSGPGSAAQTNATNQPVAKSAQAAALAADPKTAQQVKNLDELRKLTREKSAFATNARLQQVILGMEGEQLKALVEESVRQGDFWDSEQTDMRNLLLQRWTELDAPAALDYVGNLNSWAAYRVVDTVFKNAVTHNKEAAIAALGRMPEGFSKGNANAAVLSALAETNPQEALGLLDSKTIKGNPALMSSVFTTWAKADPTAAAAEWSKRAESPGANWALNGLMESWSQRDPGGAFAWAKSRTKPSDRSSALSSCVANATRKDPQEGLRMLEQLTGPDKANAKRSLAMSWAEVDPTKAEAWIRTNPNPLEKSQLLNGFAENLAYSKPEKALEIAKELPKGDGRQQILSQVIGILGWGDSEAAEKLINQFAGHEKQKLRENLIYSVGWSDPDKALEMLKANPPNDPADNMYRRLASNLGSQDPDKSLAWLKSMQDPATQRKAYPGFFGSWAATAPQDAAKEALLLTDKSMRSESIASIGSSWAASDHEKALAWANGLQGEDRSAALGAVLAGAVEYQPKEMSPKILEALQQLPNGQSPPQSFVNAATAAAGAMVAEDPRQAALWASQLPQQNCREDVLEHVTRRWADQDVTAASTWLNEVPPGLAKDKSVRALVPHIAESDPSGAFAWANAVQDSGIRSQLLETTFHQWKRADPAAAQQAVEAANWSPQEKQRWLDVLK
jgi:hypothetical protein